MKKLNKSELAEILGNSTPAMWSTPTQQSPSPATPSTQPPIPRNDYKEDKGDRLRTIVELYTAGDYKMLENALQSYGVLDSFYETNKIKSITLQHFTALFEKLLNDKKMAQAQWNKILDKLLRTSTVHGSTKTAMISNFIHSIPVSSKNSQTYMSIIVYSLGEKGEKKEAAALVKQLIDRAYDIDTMHQIIESVSGDQFTPWDFIWKKDEKLGGLGGYKWKGQAVSTTWAFMMRQVQDKTIDLYQAKYGSLGIVKLMENKEIFDFIRERTDPIRSFSWSSSSDEGSATAREAKRSLAQLKQLSQYIPGGLPR